MNTATVLAGVAAGLFSHHWWGWSLSASLAAVVIFGIAATKDGAA